MEWSQIYNGAHAADLPERGISYVAVRQNSGLSGATNIYKWRVDRYALTDDGKGFPRRDSATKTTIGGKDDLRSAKRLAETDAARD